jgi:hypothetical protein
MAANPLLTLGLVGSAQGTLTDGSGTITAGGTAQTVFTSNANRKYFFLQNISSGTLWFNFTTTAVTNEPSIQLVAGASYAMGIGGYISTEAISIIGASTGQAFVAKQG